MIKEIDSTITVDHGGTAEKLFCKKAKRRIRTK